MNWKSIIATALVTGVVTVITGLLLFYVQLREPKLVYSVEQTIPFQGDREALSIQHVLIRNDGKKSAADVVVDVRVPGGKIKERRVQVASSLPFKEEKSDDSHRFEAKSLNPGETVKISLMTAGVLDSQLNPVVSLRADGVTGERLEQEQKKGLSETILPAVVAAYAGLLAAFLSSKRYRVAIFSISKGLITGKGLAPSKEQNEVIASLFALKGLVDEAEYYLAVRKGCSYWSEADLIAAKAIACNDTQRANKYKEVLVDLLEYAEIATSSQAVLHYNIARLCKSLARNDEAQEFLKKARSIDRELVEKRLGKDPLLADMPNI